ncbi:MAG: hypothetical protein LJE74_03845 [Proteobacteria bacterium]|nr:hypothetical protein [Pseudomonadota bacterium]
MRRIGWLVVLLVIAGTAGYLAGVSTPLRERKVHRLSVAADCNPILVAGCTASDSRHVIELQLDTDTRYLKPFDIQVKTQGFKDTIVKSVSVEFNMVNMDMGLNRFRLQQVDQQVAGSVYRGQGMLPVCVTGRVDWQARVEVEMDDATYQAIFDVTITKR